MTFRILVTGSRHGQPYQTIKWAILDAAAQFATVGASPADIVVVHGGAPGVDSIAGEVARVAGFGVEVHRADWRAHGKAAGPIRNQLLVELGADIALAFPASGASPGTRDCVRRCEAAGIPVRIFEGERNA